MFIARARDLTEPNSVDYVHVVFGCWTSQSRRAVEPTFERNDHMLWYPLHYEGQECSHNVFYTGAAPNQQIEPAVDWLLHHKDPKFYLIGTDYFYPHIANDIIQAQLDTLGGRVVGINYIQAGLYTTADIQPLVDLIAQALPDGGVIFNTLSGKSNVEFYRLLPASGITPATHTVPELCVSQGAFGTLHCASRARFRRRCLASRSPRRKLRRSARTTSRGTTSRTITS